MNIILFIILQEEKPYLNGKNHSRFTWQWAVMIYMDKRDIYVTAPNLLYLTFIVGGLRKIGKTFMLIFFKNTTNMPKQLTNAYKMNQSIFGVPASLILMLSIVFWYSRLPSWSFFTTSTHNFVMFNIERYLSVVHPLWHVWIVGTSYNVALYLRYSGFTSDGKRRIFLFFNILAKYHLLENHRYPVNLLLIH